VIKFLRGNPRLLLQALPVAIGMVVLKWLYDASSARQLELSPLLTGVIAAEVFIVGFMLSGTASDFKEAERLPGELAGSLDGRGRVLNLDPPTYLVVSECRNEESAL
jgi:hypothetical protein